MDRFETGQGVTVHGRSAAPGAGDVFHVKVTTRHGTVVTRWAMTIPYTPCPTAWRGANGSAQAGGDRPR